MIKTTLTIEGMACGMCEAHVNDAVRRVCSVKKVKSSARKGITEIRSAEPLPLDELRAAIEATGYRVVEMETQSDN